MLTLLAKMSELRDLLPFGEPVLGWNVPLKYGARQTSKCKVDIFSFKFV